MVVCECHDIVVYLYIPTSNHNSWYFIPFMFPLYIFIFLHQTTTSFVRDIVHPSCISLYSYIKPQLLKLNNKICKSCISLYSYIKPQHCANNGNIQKVVYLYIPTSNHNNPDNILDWNVIVYLYIPTSNHNIVRIMVTYKRLYIFIFLHQTTTIQTIYWTGM